MVAFDEGRFGLGTWLRRRLCPMVSLGRTSAWDSCKTSTSGFGSMQRWSRLREPVSFCRLSSVESQCLQLFLRHLRHELGKGVIGVVMDSSGSHHSGQVSWPRGLHPLSLPHYSPELSQASQIFRHLRKILSNRIFTTLEELQNALIDALQHFWEHPTVLMQLTG